MNRLVYIFILTLCVGACQWLGWGALDKLRFQNDCKDEGYLIESCNCLLACLEVEYENYDQAFKKILAGFGSERLEQCISGCNN
tara:strand:- start:106 stop:357 length:252 start_codon:yes stop_codon:yes gene_type:complete